MNVIFRMAATLVIGLIISIAIWGTVFFISELTDPTHIEIRLSLAALMAFIQLLVVIRFWDESKQKVLHDIKAMFVLCGFFSALYIVASIIRYLIYHDELYLPPIVFILLIIGIGLYGNVQKYIKYHNWMKSNPSYKFPSYEPKPPSEERTIHYDEYGNYKGESRKSK
jgi:peptidoglycan/LPS O-acetylase OafA/YrhL